MASLKSFRKKHVNRSALDKEAVLDFLVTFCVKTKSKARKNHIGQTLRLASLLKLLAYLFECVLYQAKRMAKKNYVEQTLRVPSLLKLLTHSSERV
jgi:hypothetical protein